MRTLILPTAFVLACGPATSTQVHTDTAVPSTDLPLDSVRIHPINHASLALEWHGRIVLVDPQGDVQRYEAFSAPDLVLITDIHRDHLDTTTLLAMDLSRARIVAPQAVVELLPASLKALSTALANGKRGKFAGIGVEAIPMYNLPEEEGARHPKGRGNGYVLNCGNERVYLSGDTEDIPEMRALRDIDIALVCMNMPYTMSVEQAASAVLEFRPKVVYPYHYRGKDGPSDLALFQELVHAVDPGIQVRLEDWYPE